MRRRYQYLLLFAVPSVIAAFLTLFIVAAIGYGVMWLFIYGDNEWPAAAKNFVLFCAAIIALGVLLALCFASYTFGKRQESGPSRFGRHAVVAGGIAVSLVVLAALHQLSVGNIGPKPDSVVCVEYCSAQNVNVSKTPGDGSCLCLDDFDAVVLKVDLQRLRER